VKPQGRVGWKRENFYLYGAVEPATGNSFFYEFSHLDSACFQAFLNHFSQQFPDSLNLLQLDNGSFHKSITLNWPENILPIFQPAHSPELNPIERLWQYLKQFLRWDTYTNLEQLRQKLTEVLDSIPASVIASICGWDYINTALLSATS
jgi:transposase